MARYNINNPTSEIVGADFCKFYYFDGYNDLSLYEIGYCQCDPGYSYGPLVRNRNIFHYVISGKGSLTINDQVYSVDAKQGFLIPDEVLAYYEADIDDPWVYVWIHVDGPKANEVFHLAGITKENPLFIPSCETEKFEHIFKELFENNENEYYCMGKTYEILDFIITHSTNKVHETTNMQLEYVRKVIKYIQLKYNEQIKVETVATILGLNRSYLARLFKEATGCTIQDYILRCRMKEAERYLTSKEYSIQYISYAVGYSDTFTFSKAFKRYSGMSPTEYRKFIMT